MAQICLHNALLYCVHAVNIWFAAHTPLHVTAGVTCPGGSRLHVTPLTVPHMANMCPQQAPHLQEALGGAGVAERLIAHTVQRCGRVSPTRHVRRQRINALLRAPEHTHTDGAAWETR